MCLVCVCCARSVAAMPLEGGGRHGCPKPMTRVGGADCRATNRTYNNNNNNNIMFNQY